MLMIVALLTLAQTENNPGVSQLGNRSHTVVHPSPSNVILSNENEQTSDTCHSIDTSQCSMLVSEQSQTL